MNAHAQFASDCSTLVHRVCRSADHRRPPVAAFEFIHTGNDQRDHQPAEQNASEVISIPTRLLKRPSSCIAPVICHICNLSLQSGVFPAQLKQTRVLPLLKKSNMDPDIASSCQPISNLPYISKLVERVVTTH